MRDEQKLSPSYSIELITDDPDLQCITDFKSLQSHPRFIERIPSPKAIEDIIAEYRCPQKVMCAFGHWHNAGVIAVLNGGGLTQLGNICGEEHYSREEFVFRKNQFKERKDRKALARELEGLESVVQKLDAHTCREDPSSTRALFDRLQSFLRELPIDVQVLLERMAKAGSNRVVRHRRADRRERDLQQIFGGRYESGVREETVCIMAGAECLRLTYDVARLDRVSRSSVKRLLGSPSYSTKAERLKVRQDLDRIINNNGDLDRANRAIRSFLTEENLRQLERAVDGKGNKKLTRRLAQTYSLQALSRAA